MNIFEDEIILEDKRVLLRNMRQTDLSGLAEIAYEEAIWKYYPFVIEDEDGLNSWFASMQKDFESKTRIPFLIIDKELNKPAGSTSFMNISEYDKRLEIGTTWLGGQWRGSGINKNCKYLLLEYAFNRAGYKRVEFKTDFLNGRSRAALKKIGATEEGVFRSHMLMPGNRRRDSVYYSILNNEWDDIKRNYFNDLI